MGTVIWLNDVCADREARLILPDESKFVNRWERPKTVSVKEVKAEEWDDSWEVVCVDEIPECIDEFDAASYKEEVSKVLAEAIARARRAEDLARSLSEQVIRLERRWAASRKQRVLEAIPRSAGAKR